MKTSTGSGDRGRTGLFSGERVSKTDTLVPQETFSTFLAAAEEGTPLTFTGPLGYFTFRRSPRPAVFVATGTGLAPFVSMGRSGTKAPILLHGVRTPADLYYGSLSGSIAGEYVPCLSGQEEESSPHGHAFYGRVTDYIETRLPPGTCDFYLCGRREMIRDVTHLVDEYFPYSRVYTEVFF